MKWKFIPEIRAAVSECIPVDWGQVKAYVLSQQGKEMDLIIRPTVKWDVRRMQNYFEGPVCKFVAAQIQEQTGESVGKEDVRQFFKGKYLGYEDVGGIKRLASTAGLDYEKYKEFLRNINQWCMDHMQTELPPAEE